MSADDSRYTAEHYLLARRVERKALDALADTATPESRAKYLDNLERTSAYLFALAHNPGDYLRSFPSTGTWDEKARRGEIVLRMAVDAFNRRRGDAGSDHEWTRENDSREHAPQTHELIDIDLPEARRSPLLQWDVSLNIAGPAGAPHRRQSAAKPQTTSTRARSPKPTLPDAFDSDLARLDPERVERPAHARRRPLSFLLFWRRRR